MIRKQKELYCYIYLDRVTGVESEKMVPEELVSETEKAKVKKAVKNLPHPCNIILQEYFLAEKPGREIMLQLKISRNKFYNYLDKGKFLLRQELNKSFYD